jgi:Family of unknown function (DUF5677)
MPQSFGLRSDSIIRRQLAFAHHAIDVMLGSASALRWESPAQQMALALHATVIELFAGCIALVECERVAAVPIVLRSLYEAVVDLNNLLQAPTYLERMEAAELKQRMELLVQGKTNSLMRGFEQKVDISEEMKTAGTRITELERRGQGAVSIRDRCIAVGREDEYRTVYALLSLDVHNNISALGERHGEIINVFGEPDLTGVRARLSMGTKYALESATMMHQAFCTADPAIANLPLEMDALRAAIGDIEL